MRSGPKSKLIQQLVLDMRRVMAPNTALNLRVSTMYDISLMYLLGT
jgi:hypothetical protein